MLNIGVIGRDLDTIKTKIFPLILKLEMASNNYLKNISINSFVTSQDVNYIPLLNVNSIGGLRLDQIIIADDDYWEIYRYHRELIQVSKYRLSHSYVPEEFQIIELLL